MAARRWISIVDIVVAVVALVAIVLPARPLEGTSAARGDDHARFALAAAEARTRVRPDDGAVVDDLARRFVDAGELDFAVEAPAAASQVMRSSPTRWLALYATAKSWGELREVKEASEWADRAWSACQDAGPACPPWQGVRVELYAKHLEAGLASGIDPKVDPDGFRKAGENALHIVHLSPNPLITPAPTAPAGSGGSGSGSAPSPSPNP
jgi:hypothetical protein